MNTSTKSKTSFIMPDKNVTVTSNWTADVPRYRVEVKTFKEFDVYVPIAGAGTYVEGDIVNVFIIPPDGWAARWMGYSEPLSDPSLLGKRITLYDRNGQPIDHNTFSNQLSFRMPGQDVFLVASF